MDALWDAPLADVPLAFLDLETTGCDPDHDRICEIAIHRVVGGVEIDRLASLVDPGVPVGASERVHGIGDDALRGAPSLRAISPRIDALLEGAIVVGHAIAFDLAFLARAAERGELPRAPERAIDTRGLAQRALRTGSAALASLAGDLGLPPPAHRAEPDVVATRALFDVACERLRPASARHLWIAQDVGGRAQLRDDVEHALRDAIARGRAVRVCYRVPGRRAFVDVLDPWWLEPPRVEGWLRETGLRRILRGDRILWAEPTELPIAHPAPDDVAPALPRAGDA